MTKLINIGGHGLGDCMLSLQISSLLSQKNIEHQNLIATRDEIFRVIQHLCKDSIDITQIDESIVHNNSIETDSRILLDIKNKYKSNEVTYNVPDLLFRNPLALDVEQYHLNYQLIKKTRTLLHLRTNVKNIIYCGLCSNTDGYLYHDIPSLLIDLANRLQDYTIYFPYLEHWVTDINYTGNFNQVFPSNVFIDKNPIFEESIDWLIQSRYGVFTCNGPSHIAYHLGIPRLVLDPQFNKTPWITRWKEDYEECLPLKIGVDLISNLIHHNIVTPQTTMMDRKILLQLLSQGHTDWKNLLYFKY